MKLHSAEDSGTEEEDEGEQEEGKSSSTAPVTSPGRSQKRRRLEDESTGRDHAASAELSEAETEESSPDHPKETQRVEIPAGVLPRFPAPAHPDAPSKATLALQGLDRKLVEADIVDPSTVMHVGDDQGRVRLSSRTRKRLEELGISELFAGKSFLPSTILKP